MQDRRAPRVASTDRADIGVVPIGGLHRRYPIKAAMSTGRVQPDGATPIAITKATMPSMRPVERLFVSFLFPAASLSMTLLAAHILSTG